MKITGSVAAIGVMWAGLIAVAAQSPSASTKSKAPAAADTPAAREMIARYCVGCHNEKAKIGGLTLESLDLARVGDHADVWEKVARKLRGGLMPPAGRPRPDAQAQQAFVSWVEGELDRTAAAHPNPGRTETFHRLNRAEYANAIRDLLALDIDVAALLPADSAAYGFDNMAGALKVSESLFERYLSSARKVSRAAIGGPVSVRAQTYHISPAQVQNAHVDGLPFGTRGGALIEHVFPQDAEYLIRLEVAGGGGGGDVDVLLDGERLKLLSLRRGARAVDVDGNEQSDKLEVRTAIKAGPHDVGVAFLYAPVLLAEANRRPFGNPTVSGPGIAVLRSLTITGPFNPTGAGDTPSRARIFVCRPASPAPAEAACAKQILSTLARRAFRRPVADDDLGILLQAYNEARTSNGTFEDGIERALQQLLVSPEFLFRIEAEPSSVAGRAATNYRISDVDLASRLSFFLWSSIPDDQLLNLAAKGTLKNPAVLEREVRRMLADPRSEALTRNFVGQWLQLRNLQAVAPSEVLFPDFNDSLRRDFGRETELFFDSILRDDRSALQLLDADYTFLNDRLARHYRVTGVNGTHFRRVTLTDDRRRGLLGHASLLTITSQPVRTSPVFRGKYILDTLLGTPPPPPPPNVPALPEKTGVYAGKAPSMRERMAQHRDNPACANCHAMIDPLGFGLEQFDAIGRWRDVDETFGRIDTSGVLPDGTPFDGVGQLRAALLKHPDRFVTALTEKLLTYALGRGVESYDMPAVRAIVRDAARTNYKLSSIVLGITRSLPFQNRRTARAAPLVATVH